MKITDLTNYSTPLATDVLPIVDVTNDTTKKVQYQNLIPAGYITASKLDASATGHGFLEIARTTLTVAGDTITVSSIPARKYLKIIINAVSVTNVVDSTFRFNNNSGSNYSYRYSDNGAADTTAVNQTSVPLDSGNVATGQSEYAEIEILNLSTVNKIAKWFACTNTTAGAGTAPAYLYGTCKYVDSLQITRFDLLNGGAGDYAIGSEVIVLGKN